MRICKIINDPVHGFIEVPKGILLDLIDTDIFQRLRRIRQLALSSLVYPGAKHSRFNHAIGAMHLTEQALKVLEDKGVKISPQEKEATLIAILLHDIGHGPFSHALENVILQGLHHERMSTALMHHLNKQFKGKLDLAIQIFEGKYGRHFLHQLVSSQLDMDRMDYLVRDSYFTGVVEGLVPADRIIKTLDVRDDKLVIQSKGIYSVEKFLVSRRVMYWQVYLHRAVVAGEYMLVNILKRAKELMYKGIEIWSSPLLDFFFRQNDLLTIDINQGIIDKFVALDDEDILYAVKQWQNSGDRVLEILCKHLLRRELLKVKIDYEKVPQSVVDANRKKLASDWGISLHEASYFIFQGDVSNLAYFKEDKDPIRILHKDGRIEELSQASDIPNVRAMSTLVTKYFYCSPQL